MPLREHGERLLVGLGAPWFLGTCLWLGGKPPPPHWQGFRVRKMSLIYALDILMKSCKFCS